ncbi:hypothetical protein [Pseudomonas leptonychotis]|uniref:hypothetical protein n=1 Tax=Pseudomonas leptonychotis TaxID=2448482 RepID=UPI0010A9B39C|nr:hypothetical protein [Pseudomonas leptonychotis]
MNWLINFILSAGGNKIRKFGSIDPEPHELTVGIHVIYDYGSSIELSTNEISDNSIRDTILSLDWQSGFYQVICTLHPGQTMEVGGSLNGIDGLSASYRNRSENIELVTNLPPESTNEMIEILSLFINNNLSWKSKFQFE